MPNDAELALLDHWQRGFPLIERPFALVGRDAGLDETATVALFHRLAEAGVISRIGVVVTPHTVGASTLAAMRIPSSQIEAVAAIVSAEPLVNHNYERTHVLNLWFVVAAPDAAAVAGTIAKIERQTGHPVLDLPLLRAYHLDLGFPLSPQRSARNNLPAVQADYHPDPLDRTLLGAIDQGLPIVARPYRAVADRLGIDEASVLERLRKLIDAGIIRRLGCVVRHSALGYHANAMAVWDLPDERVDAVGALFKRHSQVTLCYRRPRRPPQWPYSLFCMVHAKTRREAYAVIDDLNLITDTGLVPQSVLFSTRCFKQRGATFSKPAQTH